MRVCYNEYMLNMRKQAAAVIKAIKKNIKCNFSSKEIKELINYGRKY